MAPKTCTICGEIKDSDKDYYARYNFCKKCKVEKHKEYRHRKIDVGKSSDKIRLNKKVELLTSDEKMDIILHALIKLNIVEEDF